jgi:hypothetical protein
MSPTRRRRARIGYWFVVGLVAGGLAAAATSNALAIIAGLAIAAVFGLGEQFADNVREHARLAEERRP